MILLSRPSGLCHGMISPAKRYIPRDWESIFLLGQHSPPHSTMNPSFRIKKLVSREGQRLAQVHDH